MENRTDPYPPSSEGHFQTHFGAQAVRVCLLTHTSPAAAPLRAPRVPPCPSEPPMCPLPLLKAPGRSCPAEPSLGHGAGGVAHPDNEFSGVSSGIQQETRAGTTWNLSWHPLQQTEPPWGAEAAPLLSSSTGRSPPSPQPL